MSIIEEYGYSKFFRNHTEKLSLEENLVPARVIEVHREQYKIITDRKINYAKLKGSIFYNDQTDSIYPVIGDFILVKENPYGEDVIYHVLPRKSKFSRLDSFNEKEQIVAVNFDYVFILTSLNNDFNINRIERYLASAWQSGGNPVIVLTKSDLCGDPFSYINKADKAAVGAPVFAVSSSTGEGIEELKAFIKPYSTIVLMGSSGVGKSSLVNALSGEEIMKVNSIREYDDKGRHTTTHRQLIRLENGIMIIDTPGMRSLGMWEAQDGMDTAFSDIEELKEKCRFRDCSHKGEPGCAIKEALESGELSAERWENYIKLKKETEFAERKENLDLKLKEKARAKGLSKLQKRIKKGWDY